MQSMQEWVPQGYCYELRNLRQLQWLKNQWYPLSHFEFPKQPLELLPQDCKRQPPVVVQSQLTGTSCKEDLAALGELLWTPMSFPDKFIMVFLPIGKTESPRKTLRMPSNLLCPTSAVAMIKIWSNSPRSWHRFWLYKIFFLVLDSVIRSYSSGKHITGNILRVIWRRRH